MARPSQRHRDEPRPSSRRWTAGLPLALVVLAACADPHGPLIVDRLECETCHGDLFDATPLHRERGYGRACYRCHGTLDWADANPSHGAFPIGREPHAGYDCAQCHPSREDRADYTCIECHEHRRGRVTPWHIGIPEFEYTPRSCYRCHRGD